MARCHCLPWPRTLNNATIINEMIARCCSAAMSGKRHRRATSDSEQACGAETVPAAPATCTTTAAAGPDPPCCSICLDPFGRTNNATTGCGHRFHLDCLLRWAAGNILAGHLKGTCPLCRGDVFSVYEASQLDRDLLRAVTLGRWAWMRELRCRGAAFTAAIQRGDYASNNNIGMMPLHFAIRDHAPLDVVREIHTACPAALYRADRTGLTPPELLTRRSPNQSARRPSVRPQLLYNNIIITLLYLGVLRE